MRIKNAVCYSFSLNGEDPMAHLRLIGPLRQLGINIVNGIKNNQIMVDRVSEGDMVIIQREFPKKFKWYRQIIEFAHKERKPVMFDLDDLLFHLPENHPDRQSSEYGPSLLPMFQTLMEADLISVSTPKLRDFVINYNDNVAVLPNYFDDNLWQLKPPVLKSSDRETLTIGYMGGNSHKPDLEYITPVLLDLIKRYPNKIKFHFFGVKPPVELASLPQVQWSPPMVCSYKEFSAFFQNQTADIFIAPLIDNLFNRCKSPLKFFEYSALGVPGVFSRLETYTDIVTHGQDGLLASSLEEWTSRLIQLIEDEELRFFIAKNAQETIRSKWLLSQNAFRWEETFQNFFDRISSNREQNSHVTNILESINLQLSETFNKKEAVEQILTAQAIEKERAVQTLAVQVVEKEQHIQTLTAQVVEKEQAIQTLTVRINEIINSKAWKIVLLFRRIYVLFIPSNSRRAWVLRQLINVIVGPFRKIKRNQKFKEDLALIRYSGLFDENWYLTNNPDVAQARVNPLLHYLSDGGYEGRDPGPNFSSAWYLNAYEDVRQIGINPLVHYLKYGRKEERHPNLESNDLALIKSSDLFDKTWYMANNPDIAEITIDPLLHYLRDGGFEARDPGPNFSSAWYLDTYEEVKNAGINPLVHFLKYGRSEGYKAQSTQAMQSPLSLEDSHANITLDRLAEKVAQKFNSPVLKSPTVSIIIPVYNQINFTLNCLLSIASSQDQAEYEVIIIDDASTDSTQLLLDKIPGIRYLRKDRNQGFLISCNEAAGKANGSYLVFLNNDTLVHSKWLDNLLSTFTQIPNVGLVGSKLIFPNGSLQEAGGVIYGDGSAKNYGCRGNPNRYIYNYLREVDYVSGASIMLPKTLWERLGGFDPQYEPAYYEDVDLAFKIRRAGYKVIYQPFSEVTHFEGSSNGIDVTTGVKQYQVINRNKFYNTWRNELASYGMPGLTPNYIEQDRYVKSRVLYIDDVIPKPDRHAGAILSDCYLRALRDQDYAVSFLPHFDLRYSNGYVSALQKIGIECAYLPYVPSSTSYIKYAGHRFDYVVISRASVVIYLLSYVKEFAPQAKVIFNTVDLNFLRLERVAELSQKEADLLVASKARQAELDVIQKVDCTLVVSDLEAKLLSEITPQAMVRVVPFPADIREPKNGRGERSDIVFLGGFMHPPNIDAVHYFASEIWPQIRQNFPDARFVIAGPDAPIEIQQLAGDNIIVTGFVEDLADLFATAILTVAPLRYGAGIKGKVLSSLAHGVPCIATSIAAEGMGLTNSENILIADTPLQFVEASIKIFTVPQTWDLLSKNGLDFIRRNYSRTVISSKLCEVFRELQG